MAISAAQLVVEFRATGASEVSGAIDQIDGRVKRATGGFDAFYYSIRAGAGPAIDSLNNVLSKVSDIGKGVMGIGGAITAAITGPIAAGSWMAWSQVDSVEKATRALKAYEQDITKVDAVLQDLLSFARSEQGVMFQREQLFATAQGLAVMGLETERLSDFTQVLARSVAIGTGTFEELTRVVGRVGATGRMTTDDFEMLTKMGFQLDESIRNTDMSWQELYMHLEQGIPIEAFDGQLETIQGRTTRLQSALRGLGNAFLGVDPNTSQFRPGGIGDMIVQGMIQLTDVLVNAATAAQRFGNVLAMIARPISVLFSRISMLPEPLTTMLITITALTGVLLTGAGAIVFLTSKVALAVIAFQALGGMTAIISGMGAALSLLAPAVGILTAIGVAVGGLYLAYQNNFLGFADFIDDMVDAFKALDSVLAYLMGGEGSKSVTLDISTAADAGYSDWQQMPDGTFKSAELGITATGSGAAFITKLENPDAPDGWDYTLNIDVTGDGVPDALEIIDSVNQGGGEFVMTATLDDLQYQVWYDEITGQAIYVEVEVQAGGAQEVADAIEAIVRWAEFLQKIDPWERLQNGSDAALSKIQEMADKFYEIAGILAEWSWGNLTDTSAFQTVVGHVDTLIGRLNDLKGVWEWFVGRPLFGSSDWEPDANGGITEPDTGTTAVPVPAPQDFGIPSALLLGGAQAGPSAVPMTVDIKGDDSGLREAIERVSAMVSVVDAMEARVNILGDSSDYQAVQADVSRSLDAVGRMDATVSILGDSSGYQATVADVSRSLDAVGRMSATVTILADASDVYNTISDLQVYSGTTIATSYVDIVTRRLGDPIVGRATGGIVDEDVTLVGERGPELVSLPRGSRVYTNAESMRIVNSRGRMGKSESSKGDTYDLSGMFSGAHFNNTSREEMNSWAENDLLPAVRDELRRQRVGQGVS